MFIATIPAVRVFGCLARQLAVPRVAGCGLFLLAIFSIAAPATAWAGGPPSGPYQRSCRNASMAGTTLVASCPNYFGNFQRAQLPDAESCKGDFKTSTGALLPRSIQNVDGALRCVIAFTPGTGDKAPGFDFISLLSDRTINGHEIKTWRIDRPIVWAANHPDGRVEYPIITFQAGDRLRFSAGGCVQTGGRGRTWKRYLNPSGPNAPQYYAGTAFIKNITGGSFVRIEGLVAEQNNLARQQTNLSPELRGTLGPLPKDPEAKADYILRLGYQDDQLDDNSYFAHDDGTDDQCKNVGPAFVELTVISGSAGSGPLLSPHFKPFDLVWDMNNDEDHNGLALNPQWNFALEHNGEQPHFKPLCGAAFPSVFGWNFPIDFTKLEQICTSMPVSFDLDPKGAICDGDPFPGHMNFGIATYQGQITWETWSGTWPNDNDWNFRLAPRNGAGLAGLGDGSGPAATIGLEFDFGDSDLDMPFWKDLVLPPFFGEPVSSIDSVFAGSNDDGLEGVVIGEVGLDGVHGAYSELHPVFAMAVRLSQAPIPGRPEDVVEKWAFFLRNFGDEGGCSSQTWHWESPTGEFFVPLAWPEGATDVGVDSTDVVAWQSAATPVDIEKDPENHFTLIRVRAPHGVDEFGAGGTITIQYKIPGGPKKKSAPPHRAPERKVAETETKDLSERISDLTVKARFRSAIKALAPAQRARPAARIAVTVPNTMAVRKRVPGPASRGQLTHARAVPNTAKLQRDLAIFKLMQTYAQDLKLEVPAQVPTALTPAGAQVHTK